jgi:sugar transferase (PEP-CTERM/EpsH1 system associated)
MKPLRILFVSPYLPSLIRVRPYNLIKALAQRGHQITLLALQPPNDDTGGLDSLNAWCQVVRTTTLPRWRTFWNALLALPSDTPFQAAYSRSPEMTALIQHTRREGDFDVIHVEHLRGAELTGQKPNQAVNGVPVVFDSVDSITLLFERACRSGPTRRSRMMAQLDVGRTRHYESRLLERFARVLVTSPQDRAALADLCPDPDKKGNFAVLPNGVDLDYFSPQDLPRETATLIFTGKMSYHANVAAALDLATQVMPVIWQQRPAARLTIAGKDPTHQLLALAEDPRITVTGTVPDLRPYLAQATLAVLPIRYGVGIQNKLLESMAVGTPVVTTLQATEALQAQPGRDLLVADTPQAIAGAVMKMLDDDRLRSQIGQAGRRYVEDYHDWNRVAEKLETVYREAIVESKHTTEA